MMEANKVTYRHGFARLAVLAAQRLFKVFVIFRALPQTFLFFVEAIVRAVRQIRQLTGIFLDGLAPALVVALVLLVGIAGGVAALWLFGVLEARFGVGIGDFHGAGSTTEVRMCVCVAAFQYQCGSFVRSFRAFFVQEDRAPGRRGELLTKLA